MLAPTAFLLCLTIWRLVVGVSASATSSQACNDLFVRFPNRVAYPPLDITHLSPANLNYTYTATHYWNAAHGQLLPTCVFYPATGADVATAVQILNQYPDVPWAAKSGGHNANKDWSSVRDGVLISFRPFMQGTRLNADGTADLQPGGRWSEALAALEPYNRAVVGGRLGDVGVGGYILGGGLSFLSAEYGLACDLLQEIEIVLADGTLTTASGQTNPDLFFALRGGGNQFAIVTNYKFQTVPIGSVWGGIKIYTMDKASALLNATQDFAANYPDPKAAIIPTFESLFQGYANVFFVFYFYNGPVVPSGVFDRFNAIQPLIDQTKVQSYASLLSANDVANLYGANYLIRSQTIPSLPGDAGRDTLQYQFNSFLDYARQTQPQNFDFMVYSFAVQPLPVMIQNASLTTSASISTVPNTFGFDLSDGDRIWMEYDISWINPLDEGNAFRYANHFTTDIRTRTQAKYPNTPSTHQTNPAANQYEPLFLNDAMADQATSLFFKPDIYQRLKAIQRSRDPAGFFSRRTGGAKFT